MSVLNKTEKLQLDKLIQNADANYVDNTEHIRKVKHSKQLIHSVGIIELLKSQYAELRKTNPEEFNDICRNKCPFIFNNYTDIFNKLINDELDLQLLSRFLQVLSSIEKGDLDQNDASVVVGKILKEIYIDSALRRSAKLDAIHSTETVEPVATPIVSKNISWNTYKQNRDFITRGGVTR
jgi:hypothetical protein